MTTRYVAEHAPDAPPDGEGLGFGEGLGEVTAPPHPAVESSQVARRSVQSRRYCT
ncbi:hypothetical protein ACFYOK_07860 [Microbispora bryophytorum]|uniref:hypothetical protein n=1 Tax=Microbispora bryophytorum TaxID=1460882 RepID=UPI0033FDAE22